MKKLKKVLLGITSAVMAFASVATAVYAEDSTGPVTVNADNVFTKTEYYEDNPLGIAGNFHLVGFNSVKTGTHTNGNILTKTLYYNSNFGTNGLAGEVSYIQNIGNDISSFQFSGDSEKILVVGKDVTVGTADNGSAWTLNGAKVDNPSKNKYPNSVMQDSDDVQFIDIDSVKAEMISLNKTMAAYEDFGVTKELVDQNNQSVTIQNNATANVVNLTLKDFNVGNILTGKGFEKGQNATLIINMDLAGTSDFSFAGSEIEYTDGTKASHGEVTQWQDGNVVWNFYDSSASDGMYHGKISNTRATAGLIVAPEATVDLTQNFNGTVIANDIIVSAESHRTDFTGKTIVPGGKDGEKPGDSKQEETKTYTIKFVDYDETSISETTYNEGDTVVKPENPTRSEDDTYTYTFEKWEVVSGTDTSTATNDVTYKATYTATPKQTAEKTEVEVKLEWEGEPAEEETTATLTANDEEVDTTVLSDDNNWEDTFEDLDKFDEEGEEIKYDVEMDEIDGYEQTKNVKTRMFTFRRVKQVAPKTETYTVTFLDDDETELNSMEYEEGDTVTYPDTPSKDSEGNCSYTFSGWTLVDGTELGENGEVKGNAVYKASYTKACIYTVKFVDYDDKAISEATYDEGNTATVPANPTRDADDEYTYEFDKWNFVTGTDISNDWIVDGDATYKASYTATKKAAEKYAVVYQNYDGTTISSNEYEKGSTVTVPENPTRDSEGKCSYTFSNWELVEGTALGEGNTAQGNATYKAVFTEACKVTVIFEDEDGTKLSETDYNVGDTATYPENPSKDDTEWFHYDFDKWALVNGTALSDENIVNGDATYKASYKTTLMLRVIFQDYDETEISNKQYASGSTAEIPENPTRDEDDTYTYSFDKWVLVEGTALEEDNVVHGSATYQATYKATKKQVTPVEPEEKTYNVTFLTDDGKTITTETVKDGEKVVMIDGPEKESEGKCDYTFTGWKLVSGTELGENDVANGDATFQATYSKACKVTVVFEDEDGTKLSEKDYNIGDKAEFPENPSKAADDTYAYSFNGWLLKEGTGFGLENVVNGDVTYKASYTATADAGRGDTVVGPDSTDDTKKVTEETKKSTTPSSAKATYTPTSTPTTTGTAKATNPNTGVTSNVAVYGITFVAAMITIVMLTASRRRHS